MFIRDSESNWYFNLSQVVYLAVSERNEDNLPTALDVFFSNGQSFTLEDPEVVRRILEEVRYG